MDIIGLKKIISLDELWEIAVPSGKTVDWIRSGGSPIGVSPPKPNYEAFRNNLMDFLTNKYFLISFFFPTKAQNGTLHVLL